MGIWEKEKCKWKWRIYLRKGKICAYLQLPIYENFNTDSFYWASYWKVFISGEILLLLLSGIKFSIYVMVNLIQMLQLTYYHLIPVHNPPFSFTSTTFLQVSGLVSHKYTQSGPIFVIGGALWAEKFWRCHENCRSWQKIPSEDLSLRST